MTTDSTSVTGRNPWHLTTIELLLEGHPSEFLTEWSEDQPGNARIRAGVSDQALMIEAAERWSASLALNEEERAHIRAVWLDGENRSPLNPTTARRDALRAMLQRVPA